MYASVGRSRHELLTLGFFSEATLAQWRKQRSRGTNRNSAAEEGAADGGEAKGTDGEGAEGEGGATCRGTHLEEELAQVEAKLAESIKASGADSEGSVALVAEQAEKVRQEIKRVQSGQENSIGAAQSAQEEMAIFSRSSRLASHGFASDADGWQTDLEQRGGGEAAGGGRSSLSEEELALIQQHRQGQALVSDRRSRSRASCHRLRSRTRLRQVRSRAAWPPREAAGPRSPERAVALRALSRLAGRR